MKTRLCKSISLFLSALLFLTNSGFASSLESNFWKERNSLNKNLAESQDQRFAEVPANFGQVLKQFPAVQTEQFNSAIPQKISSPNSTRHQDQYSELINAIPAEYGTVKKVMPAKLVPASSSKSEKTIIHIQDVHMNAEAQANIGKTVSSLMEGKKAGLIGLEGAFAPIDLSRVRAFDNKYAVEIVAEYLLKENRISGAVHAGLTSSMGIPPFVGVDHLESYNANVQAFRDSRSHVESDKKSISSAISKNNKEISVRFESNHSLALFHQKVSQYRNGNLSLGEYVKALTNHLSSIPTDVEVFLEAYKLEKSIDFKKVESERTSLLSSLLPKLKKEETTELINKSIGYRVGNVRHTDFYQYLINLIHKKQLSYARYPGFDAYIQYVMLADSVNPENLFSTLAKLESDRYQSLTKSPTEKKLIGESKYLHLVSKLVEFSLTYQEWTEYKLICRGVHQEYGGRPTASSHQKNSDLNLTSGPPAAGRATGSPLRDKILNLPNLDVYERFYDEAENRNKSITANLLRSMDENNVQVAVLVTGGFHAPGIDALLTDHGASVISFVPKISKVDTESGSQYLSAFTQEKTSLDQLFSGEKLFVSQNPAQLGLATQLEHATDNHLLNHSSQVAVQGITGKLQVNFSNDHKIISAKFSPFGFRKRITSYISTFLLFLTTFLSQLSAQTQFNPAAPLTSLSNAIDFIYFQITPTNFPANIRTNPLPPTFYVPPGVTGYSFDATQKAAIDTSVGLYSTSLSVLALLKTGNTNDLKKAESILNAYAFGYYGDMALRAYPQGTVNNNSFSPFGLVANYIFNNVKKTGKWDASWNFYDVDTGQNAWLLIAINEYVKTMRKLGLTPNSNIVFRGETTAKGMHLLVTDDGAIRFGPKRNNATDSTFWDLISTENNISAYKALRAWGKTQNNSSYLFDADNIWKWIVNAPVYVLKNGSYVKQTGMLYRNGNDVYFMAGAHYNTGLSRWEADLNFYTDAAGLWAFEAFGAEKIDAAFGDGTAMKIMETIRRKTGRNNQKGPVSPQDRIDGFDASSTYSSGISVSGNSWLIIPEWSDPFSLRSLQNYYLLKQVTGESTVTIDQIASVTKDFFTVSQNMNTTNGNNYAYGPGLSSPRNGDIIFTRVPLKQSVKSLTAIKRLLNGPLSETVEPTSHSILTGFAKFLDEQGETIKKDGFIVDFNPGLSGSFSEWHTNAQNDSIFVSAVNVGDVVTFQGLVKTASGQTNQQSLTFTPLETRFSATVNGQSFSYSNPDQNTFDETGLIVTHNSTNENSINLLLPQRLLDKVPSDVLDNFKKGPIKIGFPASDQQGLIQKAGQVLGGVKTFLSHKISSIKSKFFISKNEVNDKRKQLDSKINLLSLSHELGTSKDVLEELWPKGVTEQMPAYEFLKTLFQGLEVGDIRTLDTFPDGKKLPNELTLKRIWVNPLDLSKKTHSGIEAVQLELSDDSDRYSPTQFNLLYNEKGFLIGIFPYSEEPLFHHPSCITLPSFYIELPSFDEFNKLSKDEKAFRELLNTEKFNEDKIRRQTVAYMNGQFNDWNMPDGPVWTIHEGGGILVGGVSIEKHQRFLIPYSDWGSQPEKIGFNQFFIPVLPTVFTPYDKSISWPVLSDQDFYHVLLGQKPDLFKLNSEKNTRSLVIGTGSGLDSIITLLQTNGEVWVSDRNPFAIANLKVLLNQLGLESRVKTFVLDNAGDFDGNPHFLDDNGTPIQFDHVVWNMPIHHGDKLDGKKGRISEIWDGVGPQTLKTFALTLPKILKKGGKALIWNFEKSDEIAQAFETAGVSVNSNQKNIKKVMHVNVYHSNPDSQFKTFVVSKLSDKDLEIAARWLALTGVNLLHHDIPKLMGKQSSLNVGGGFLVENPENKILSSLRTVIESEEFQAILISQLRIELNKAGHINLQDEEIVSFAEVLSAIVYGKIKSSSLSRNVSGRHVIVYENGANEAVNKSLKIKLMAAMVDSGSEIENEILLLDDQAERDLISIRSSLESFGFLVRFNSRKVSINDISNKSNAKIDPEIEAFKNASLVIMPNKYLPEDAPFNFMGFDEIKEINLETLFKTIRAALISA